jgi:hypothetical protein
MTSAFWRSERNGDDDHLQCKPGISGELVYLRTAIETSIDGRDSGRHTHGPLVHFEDASRLDDGRFFLALGKPHGAIAVDIDACKLFAVMVIDGDLPVAMPAPTIFVKPAGFPFPLPLRFLFHGLVTLEKCHELSQVRDARTSTQLGVNPGIT